MFANSFGAPVKFWLGCLVALWVSVFSAHAVPANPRSIELVQPNGTRFHAFTRGDEFQGWMETAHGATVVRNPDTGYFEYAQQSSNGELLPSGTVVVNSSAAGAFAKGLRPVRNVALEQYHADFLNSAHAKRFYQIGRAGQSPAEVPSQNSVQGSRKLLVVLVDFADASLSAGSAAYWNDAFFNLHGASVAKYFQDNSFGAFSIAPVAHAQPGSPAGVVRVSLPQNHPRCAKQCSYAMESAWVNRALAEAARFANFVALDANGDGNVDADEALIYFIVAGYEASAGSGLSPSSWSHRWGGDGVSVAGKRVSHWVVSGEMQDAASRTTIGPIAHEVAHALGGLPDLHDMSHTNAGMGGFSLMASGAWGRKAGELAGATPVALDALSRQYAGWSAPQLPLDGTTALLVSGLVARDSALMLLNSSLSANEYWLLENRPPVGWDAGMVDFLGAWTGGVLIQHVDLSAGAPSLARFNSLTAVGKQGSVVEEPAGAACSLKVKPPGLQGCPSMLFYGGNASAFHGATIPGTNYYSGGLSDLGVTGISAPGSTMTATVGRAYIASTQAVPEKTNLTVAAGKTSVINGVGTSGTQMVRATSTTGGGVNVALASQGGVATASSNLSGHLPSHINNGDRAGIVGGVRTVWIDGTPGSLPDWVQINFNGSKTIDQIVVYTIQDNYNAPLEPTDTMTFATYGARDYAVQTWNGSTWVTQATVTGNNLVKRSFTFPAVTTDRIRVNVTLGGTNGYSYFAEVEAWTVGGGTAPSAPTIGTATAGNASASVAFTPGALGSGTLVNYTADCGGITATGTSSPISVGGLTNGNTYNCKVKTTSSVGTSPWSALSNSVTLIATPVNVALASQGGVATASSNLSGHLPSHINNGDRAGIVGGVRTVWIDGTPGSLPDWVQINFNGSKTIDQIVVYTIQDNYNAPLEPTDTMTFATYGARDYAVQTWNGSTWVTQATVTGNNLVKRSFTFPAVTTDRIRVNVTLGGTNGYSYFAEVEAWTVGGGTAPSAPTIGTATAGNASASVAFTPGALGSGTLVNYTADCGGITATGTSSPISVGGLTNGNTYNCKVMTTSSVGTSPWSALSNSFVPTAATVLPSAPSIGPATAGDAKATVTFTPGALGSGTLVSYTADCNGITASGAATPITVTGLTNGITYNCKVKTTSSVGTSPWSALSNSITPSGPAVPVNVALSSNGGVASASSTISGYPASNVNNNERTGGNGSLLWIDTTAVYPDWVEINFSGAKTINRVVLFTIQDNSTNPVEPTDTLLFTLYGITNFEVQTWSGSTWVTQAMITGNNLVKRTVSFPSVTTDRIRLNFTAGAIHSNGHSYVAEIEAWTVGSGTTPSAPTIGTAIAGNASASVAFTPGALGSGSLVNYTADCGGITATGTFSPISVGGLTNGNTYNCKVMTTSSVGTSPWSALSNSFVPTAATVLPSAPSIGPATAGDAKATVTFTPGALGSGTLVSYTADCNGITASGAATPITVTGLTNGITYNCKVKTTSSAGTGPWSALSNAVTPTVGVTLPSAPTIGTATPSLATVTVSFTPGPMGTGTLINYTADCDGTTANGNASPIAIGGVNPGPSMACRVRTNSSVGTSPWSAIANPTTVISAGTMPDTPVIGVATPGNGAAYVDFTPGSLHGNTLINYTADCGGFIGTDTASPIAVTGLANGTSYTCKVKTNTTIATTVWSASSNTVIPLAGITPPSAPTIGTVTPGFASAKVAFTPGALGSGTLVKHTADCSGITANASASPITVTGLTPGVSTTCKVRTTTTAGVSAWSGTSGAVVVSTSEVTYFHNDISGSPMVATDSSGAVVWKENYRPYGERVNAGNQSSSASNSVWFAGKQFDSSTGLSYMGARYYDPVLGRFMGVDPIGVREDNIHSFNRYNYANNNPYKFVDPDGRDPEAISSWKAAENLSADSLRKAGWTVEEGVKVVLKGLPGELDKVGYADHIARKAGDVLIGEVKDGKGAKLSEFQKAMFGEAGALERLTISSMERARGLNLKAGEMLVAQLNVSEKVAYTLTGELGGRAARQAAERVGGNLATKIAFGTLRVVGSVGFMILTQPGN